MSSLLEDFLEVVDRRSADSGAGALDVAGQLAALEEGIHWHVAILESLERRFGPEGATESHRPLVPLYQRWLLVARRLFQTSCELRRQGQVVVGMDDLAFAMNRAKPLAEDFDEVLAINRRAAGGPRGPSRTLDEILGHVHA